MPRFAANLSWLFTELPFLDRFEAAARAGFQAIEYLFPYDFPAEQIAERLARYDLKQVLFNLPPGDWAAGERGLAVLPGRQEEFRAAVEKGIAYATALGCRQLHCMAGLAPIGVDPAVLRQTYVANLRHAAERLGQVGIRLVIEPINTRDMPGYYLTTSRQALELMDAVGSDNLALQYDIHHMQVMEGDLAPTMERLLPRIGHVQIADTPGRHEPGTGEINYSFLFAHLDRIGYAGWVGCEYKPLTTTEAGLGWLGALPMRAA